MTKMKNNFANNPKTIDKFAEIKHLIEWLEEKIVGLEGEIRDRIKEKAVETLNIAKDVREKEFQAYENAFKTEINAKTKYLENEFEEKQEAE